MADKAEEREPYLIQRSYRSSNRLNFNHWLIKESCGFLLHPKIDKPHEATRIADVGTGTALWLLETAETVPKTVQLHGFDISPTQFPPEPWRPQNVHFTEHDIFQPFPTDHQGKYDVVHAQLLVCLINDPDAELVLKHLASLLKPGGQLQWLESDYALFRVKSYKPGASTTHCETLLKMFEKPRPSSSYNWLSQLPQLFEKCGMVVEAHDEVRMKDHLRLPWGQSTIAGIEDVIPDMVKDGKVSGGKLDELIPGLVAEFKEGVTVDHPWQVLVGRKG